MRATTYQISSRSWKAITLAADDLDLFVFRIGHQIVWQPEKEEVLIIGGAEPGLQTSNTVKIDRLKFLKNSV